MNYYSNFFLSIRNNISSNNSKGSVHEDILISINIFFPHFLFDNRILKPFKR